MLAQSDNLQGKQIPAELKAFFKQINNELAKVVDKEIMVYIHGTKVDFTKAAVLTAEVEHFAGRDFVSFAYAWPSHQNILSYLLGTDVKRARDSSLGLTEVLILLARQTNANDVYAFLFSRFLFEFQSNIVNYHMRIHILRVNLFRLNEVVESSFT